MATGLNDATATSSRLHASAGGGSRAGSPGAAGMIAIVVLVEVVEPSVEVGAAAGSTAAFVAIAEVAGVVLSDEEEQDATARQTTTTQGLCIRTSVT